MERLEQPRDRTIYPPALLRIVLDNRPAIARAEAAFEHSAEDYLSFLGIFFPDFRAWFKAIATDCFWDFPFFISVFTFLDTVSCDVPFFNGMTVLLGSGHPSTYTISRQSGRGARFTRSALLPIRYANVAAFVCATTGPQLPFSENGEQPSISLLSRAQSTEKPWRAWAESAYTKLFQRIESFAGSSTTEASSRAVCKPKQKDGCYA